MRLVPAALALLVALAAPALSDDGADRLRAAVEGHILPGFATLDIAAAALADTARTDCEPGSPALRAAYGTAFDAWISVSHLRFGPAETGDRAYALAFWPDPRGATPDALRGLIAAEDPAVGDPARFADVSVAARGFYALEYLLYDPAFPAGPYGCALIRAVAGDIAANAAAIHAGWQAGFAEAMTGAGTSDRYRSLDEALQEILKAIAGGLQLTAEARLARPMGTFDAPRPTRAEVRRSGRSLRHVVLSLTATRDLARRIAPPGADAAATDAAFARAIDIAARLEDPVFAGVSDPAGRLKVEVLWTAVEQVRARVAGDLGPALGVAQGFNAQDGD